MRLNGPKRGGPSKYKVDYLRVKISPNTEGSGINVVFKNM